MSLLWWCPNCRMPSSHKYSCHHSDVRLFSRDILSEWLFFGCLCLFQIVFYCCASGCFIYVLYSTCLSVQMTVGLWSKIHIYLFIAFSKWASSNESDKTEHKHTLSLGSCAYCVLRVRASDWAVAGQRCYSHSARKAFRGNFAHLLPPSKEPRASTTDSQTMVWPWHLIWA